jgi:hypothetical protein
MASHQQRIVSISSGGCRLFVLTCAAAAAASAMHVLTNGVQIIYYKYAQAATCCTLHQYICDASIQRSSGVLQQAKI